MKKKFYYSEGNWIQFLNKSDNFNIDFSWEYVKIQNTNTTINPNKKYKLSEIADKDLVFDNLHRNANGSGSSFLIYEATYSDGQWTKGDCKYQESGGSEDFYLKENNPLNIGKLLTLQSKNYFIEPYECSDWGPKVIYYYLDDNDEPHSLVKRLDKIGDCAPALDDRELDPSSSLYAYGDTYYKASRSNNEYTYDINSPIVPSETLITSFDPYYIYINRKAKGNRKATINNDGSSAIWYLNEESVKMNFSELQEGVTITISIVTPTDSAFQLISGTKNSISITPSPPSCKIPVEGDSTLVFECDGETSYIPNCIHIKYESQEEEDVVAFQQNSSDYRWEAVISNPQENMIITLYVKIQQ